jgi:GDPmannose 4,6-dehydratase
MSAKRALITGITGQDGSYLADLLLAKGYDVHGTVRRSLSPTTFQHLEHIRDAIVVHRGELADRHFLIDVLRTSQPHEIYNLAAMSSASESWNQPVLAGDVSGVGVTRLLEAARAVSPEARFFQASSAEIFGNSDDEPQTEVTPIRPNNPYGAAKAYAHFIAASYRDQHGLFASSGILYNHESPRRSLAFVTRKVTRRAAAIKLGLHDDLPIGNMEARRDWGFAGDYVEAMWLMLQQDEPDDYVIATGETHSVRDLVQIAFSHLGLDPERHVHVDPRFVRPLEATQLVGDSTKARVGLGWRPRTSFDALVRQMVEADLQALAVPAS